MKPDTATAPAEWLVAMPFSGHYLSAKHAIDKDKVTNSQGNARQPPIQTDL
jgi:hypothetical protein